MDQRIDKEAYTASITQLMEIYKDISETSNEMARLRCPYKNASHRCTAKFGCRNQLFDQGQDNPALCNGSDKLNYKDSWET